jgi:hypothetical protein
MRESVGRMKKRLQFKGVLITCVRSFEIDCHDEILLRNEAALNGGA